MEKLVEVNNLVTQFKTEDGTVMAVDGVSFHINKGETIGVVGESGCGKSVTALSIMGLLPKPMGSVKNGEIKLEGKDITKLSEAEMRKVRGKEIAMIFQEPMTSLNPLHTVGRQIAETIMLHQKISRREAMEKACEMLKKVGIPSPEQRTKEYPYQMSGGMRQRVMIAMALSCSPKMLIADEPTTALDVTIQAQILELMKQLRHQGQMAIMLITHNLGVVSEMAERVMVMYAGKVAEIADVESIFKNPLHPYTKGLMKAVPSIEGQRERLHVIHGVVPSLYNMPKGCRFAPRCPIASDKCTESQPELRDMGGGHMVACNMREVEE